MTGPETDLSRGGFQNRDVGRSLFNHDDFGPEHGIDFALYSITNDYQADEALKMRVCVELENHFPGFCSDLDLHARNGFIFLKGSVMDEAIRGQAGKLAASVEGVIKVINVLSIRS